SEELINAMIKQLQASNRTQRIEEMRSADRFYIAPFLNAEFDSKPVRIEDVSKRGSRIESNHKIPEGSAAMLRFAIPDTTVTAEVTGSVVWSAVKSVDPIRYRAGVEITDKSEVMRLAIG